MPGAVIITRWTVIPAGMHRGGCNRLCGSECAHVSHHTGPCLCWRHERQWRQKVRFKRKGKPL